MKNLVVFMPYNWPTISLKVFKSFVDVIGADVQDELREKEIRHVPFIHDRFNNLDYTQNDAVERSLNEFKAEWIMFMDGDMTFPKRTIPMLLETISEKYPVVCGMYWRKKFPHHCIVGRYSANRNQYKLTAESLGFVDAVRGGNDSRNSARNSYDPVRPIRLDGSDDCRGRGHWGRCARGRRTGSSGCG